MDSLVDFLNQRKGNGTFNKSELIEKSRAEEYDRGIDRLIRGLVDLLPKPDTVWPIEDRVKWLRLAAGIFDLGYKSNDGEPGEISIVAVKEAAVRHAMR